MGRLHFQVFLSLEKNISHLYYMFQRMRHSKDDLFLISIVLMYINKNLLNLFTFYDHFFFYHNVLKERFEYKQSNFFNDTLQYFKITVTSA